MSHPYLKPLLCEKQGQGHHGQWLIFFKGIVCHAGVLGIPRRGKHTHEGIFQRALRIKCCFVKGGVKCRPFSYTSEKYKNTKTSWLNELRTYLPLKIGEW